MCTVGSRRFWSNTRAVAALFCNEIGGVNWLDGLAVGGASSVGKSLKRTFGAFAQPAVVAPPTVAVHRYTCPGTADATDVTWNVATGSNANP
jgi:hypothetical protein